MQAQFLDAGDFKQFVSALRQQAAGLAPLADDGTLRTMRDFAAFINAYAGAGAARAVE